jgi:hypothetical protein
MQMMWGTENMPLLAVLNVSNILLYEENNCVGWGGMRVDFRLGNLKNVNLSNFGY